MQHSDKRKAGREKKKDGRAMGGRQVDKCNAMRVRVAAAAGVVGGGGRRVDKEKRAATRKGRHLILFLFNGRDVEKQLPTVPTFLIEYRCMGRPRPTAADVPLQRMVNGPHRSATHTVCVCLNAAAGEMFVGNKDSRQCLERLENPEMRRKGFTGLEGNSLECSSQTVALFAIAALPVFVCLQVQVVMQ